MCTAMGGCAKEKGEMFVGYAKILFGTHIGKRVADIDVAVNDAAAASESDKLYQHKRLVGMPALWAGADNIYVSDDKRHFIEQV